MIHIQGMLGHKEHYHTLIMIKRNKNNDLWNQGHAVNMPIQVHTGSSSKIYMPTNMDMEGTCYMVVSMAMAMALPMGNDKNNGNGDAAIYLDRHSLWY